jgi:hypothetical protein
MLASGSLVLSLAWGMALSQADLQFADVYPRAANEFARITNGMTAYYAGEWGFRYYFSQAGAEQLPVDESQVRGGSFLALPRLALPYDVPADLSSMTMPLQTLTYEATTPLRTLGLDRQTPAGFYSTGWGLVPFSFSRRALEEVEIRQVNFLVERLPWSQVESVSSIKPWPGYLQIQEKNPLAIVAKPGTKVLYRWTEPQPLILEMICGVAEEPDPSKRKFTFSVRQLDSGGKVVSSCERTLDPARKKEDRGWVPLRIMLQGRSQGAQSLELTYESDEKNSETAGAFAEAFLRRPD